MAIYHLSAQIISRKAGRSSTAAAAYRAGERIVDERTGEIHDFTRKGGVSHTEIVMPSGSDWAPTRSELWNAVEAKNKRADSQVAREFVVALPDELDESQRRELAMAFARELADKYQIAVDVAIHAPGTRGDQRNHHAHILTSTNKVQGHGFGNKARELDFVAHNMAGKVGQANEIDLVRERWEQLANQALEKAGQEARIDHRSLEDQGIYDRAPTVHLGSDATAIKRRGGVSTIEERAKEQAAEFMAEMQAHVALQRAAEKDLAELEAQLAQAQWEARPVSERMERAQRLIQEREAAIADLAERRSELYRLHRLALPRAQVEEAKHEAAELAKAVRAARAHVQSLEAESEGLSPLRFIRRRQLDRALPEARKHADETAARFMAVTKVAERPLLEEVDSELDRIGKAIEPGETLARDAKIELMALEGQQKAQEARREALEMARQVRAAAEASRAAAAVSRAAVKQSQVTRERERDQGPTLGM